MPLSRGLRPGPTAIRSTPLGIRTLPSLSECFTIINPDRVSRFSGLVQHVHRNAKPMNLHTYIPRHLLRPVSNHIDIRRGIAAGSSVGFSQETRRQLIDWLTGLEFTHFITLATNSPELKSVQRQLSWGDQGHDRMMALAKAWEARMDRQLLGPGWNRPCKRKERLQAFFALERADVNPHWHVLVRIEEPDPVKHANKIQKIVDQADGIWTSLIPSGSTDTKEIYDDRAAKYIAKELSRAVSCDYFILPGQFAGK